MTPLSPLIYWLLSGLSLAVIGQIALFGIAAQVESAREEY